LLRDLLKYARKLLRTEAKLDYFATALSNMFLFEDDLQERQRIKATFLMAQAHLGLGQAAQARKLLKSVLARAPSHDRAARLEQEMTMTMG
jgi:hypothetical protein